MERRFVMVKKIKKNGLLIVILLALFGFGVKHVVSAAQVASVIATRHEVWYVYGGKKVSYRWKQLNFKNGFSYKITSSHYDDGVNPGYMYTYHYTVN